MVIMISSNIYQISFANIICKKLSSHNIAPNFISELELIGEGSCETGTSKTASIANNVIDCQDKCLQEPLCYAMEFNYQKSGQHSCFIITEDTRQLKVGIKATDAVEIDPIRKQCYKRTTWSKYINLITGMILLVLSSQK